jgi:hypothetical protein
MGQVFAEWRFIPSSFAFEKRSRPGRAMMDIFCDETDCRLVLFGRYRVLLDR